MQLPIELSDLRTPLVGKWLLAKLVLVWHHYQFSTLAVVAGTPAPTEAGSVARIRILPKSYAGGKCLLPALHLRYAELSPCVIVLYPWLNAGWIPTFQVCSLNAIMVCLPRRGAGYRVEIIQKGLSMAGLAAE